MNHIQVLKRAWNILWSYKTLWVFGILLALATGGSINNSAGSRGNINYVKEWPPQITTEELNRLPEGIREAVQELNQMIPESMPPETVGKVIAIVAVLVCLALLVALVLAVVRYVSRTALIRMVDKYEVSGEKVNWREGFRLGWSRSALRLFLIDLLIFLPFLLGGFALFSLAAAPLLVSIALGGFAPIAGMVMTIGLGVLAIFTVLLAAVAVHMVREVFYRECILRGRGVLDSFRYGYAVLRSNLKDLVLLWLLLLAVQIGYVVLMIPVVISLVAVGLVLGGGVGGMLFLILQGGSPLTALIVAAVSGLLVMMATVGIPTLFLRGLRETYLSIAWTLGYRELPAPDSAGDAH
jgi:hypothetical protein